MQGGKASANGPGHLARPPRGSLLMPLGESVALVTQSGLMCTIVGDNSIYASEVSTTRYTGNMSRRRAQKLVDRLAKNDNRLAEKSDEDDDGEAEPIMQKARGFQIMASSSSSEEEDEEVSQHDEVARHPFEESADTTSTTDQRRDESLEFSSSTTAGAVDGEGGGGMGGGESHTTQTAKGKKKNKKKNKKKGCDGGGRDGSGASSSGKSGGRSDGAADSSAIDDAASGASADLKNRSNDKNANSANSGKPLVGIDVEIQGLKAKPELNGRLVMVVFKAVFTSRLGLTVMV